MIRGKWSHFLTSCFIQVEKVLTSSRVLCGPPLTEPRDSLLPLLIAAKVGVQRMTASLASGRALVSAVLPAPPRFLLSLCPTIFTLASRWLCGLNRESGIGNELIPLSGMQACYRGGFYVLLDVHQQLGTFEHPPSNPVQQAPTCLSCQRPGLLLLYLQAAFPKRAFVTQQESP